MKNSRFWVVCLFILFITACDMEESATSRNKRLESLPKTIKIAAVWPWETHFQQFGQGMDLAVSEINQKGGILGKPVQLIKRNDNGSIDRGILIANELKNDLDIGVVIGHVDSYISIPASSIYQFAGILMLNPGTTSTKLTKQGFNHVFRMIPNNAQLAKEIIQYVKQKQYKKIVILYPRNDYGRDFANQIENQLTDTDISVENRHSYLPGVISQKSLLNKWKNFYQFDAIILPGIAPNAAAIVSQIREQGLKQPIIGGDGLDTPLLTELAGKNSEGTVVVSFYNSKSNIKKNAQFKKKFMQTYGEQPNAAAAIGYDAILLIAHAIQQTQSVQPQKISDYFHRMPPWQGVTTPIAFDDKGDLKLLNPIYKKKVINGKFHPLP